MMTPVSATIDKAFKAACEVRQNAYTPYSHFKVGAVLVTKDDQLISGCNVENASFGATVCAERNAVFQWVAETAANGSIDALVLVTSEADAVPCGLCLQVLSEFCPPELPIYIGTPEKLWHKKSLSDFLPRPFSKSSLPKV